MSELSPTRESDFDGQFKYALYEDYMTSVEAGHLTMEDAMRMFQEDCDEGV